jgi:hypothetical protein
VSTARLMPHSPLSSPAHSLPLIFLPLPQFKIIDFGVAKFSAKLAAAAGGSEAQVRAAAASSPGTGFVAARPPPPLLPWHALPLRPCWPSLRRTGEPRSQPPASSSCVTTLASLCCLPRWRPAGGGGAAAGKVWAARAHPLWQRPQREPLGWGATGRGPRAGGVGGGAEGGRPGCSPPLCACRRR